MNNVRRFTQRLSAVVLCVGTPISANIVFCDDSKDKSFAPDRLHPNKLPSFEECNKSVCMSKIDMFKKAMKYNESSQLPTSTQNTRIPTEPVMKDNDNLTESKTNLNNNQVSDNIVVSNAHTPTPSDNDNNKDEKDNNDSFNPSIKADVDQDECPLDKEQLGHYTWNLIHTISVNLPDTLTDTHRLYLTRLMTSLAYLYPCHICAPDFIDYVNMYPPRVETREQFILWCCHFHNYINTKLGKDTFDCTLPRLEERWKYGYTSCWNHSEPSDTSTSAETNHNNTNITPLTNENDSS